jgi:uncharacterized integral membrane protein
VTDRSNPPPDESPRSAVTRSRAERARLAVAFVLGALVVLFAVLNLERVVVHWIFFVSLTPLIVVILLCLLIGVAIGWVVARRRS